MTTDSEALVEALRLTVPLHIRQLEAHLASLPRYFDRDEVLGAREYAPRGDMMMFLPTASSHHTAARQAGLALSEGIAAAALLNPDTGVEAFGAHVCARDHEGCPTPRPKPTRAAVEYMRQFHAILDEYEALLDAEAASTVRSRPEPVQPALSRDAA